MRLAAQVISAMQTAIASIGHPIIHGTHSCGRMKMTAV